MILPLTISHRYWCRNVCKPSQNRQRSLRGCEHLSVFQLLSPSTVLLAAPPPTLHPDTQIFLKCDTGIIFFGHNQIMIRSAYYVKMRSVASNCSCSEVPRATGLRPSVSWCPALCHHLLLQTLRRGLDYLSFTEHICKDGLFFPMTRLPPSVAVKIPPTHSAELK